MTVTFCVDTSIETVPPVTASTGPTRPWRSPVKRMVTRCADSTGHPRVFPDEGNRSDYCTGRDEATPRTAAYWATPTTAGGVSVQ